MKGLDVDKLIKFDFFYNSKVATRSILPCTSTGSRPLTLLSLHIDLSYFGHRFSHFFSHFWHSQVITHLSPHKQSNTGATREVVQGSPRGIITNRRNNY